MFSGIWGPRSIAIPVAGSLNDVCVRMRMIAGGTSEPDIALGREAMRNRCGLEKDALLYIVRFAVAHAVRRSYPTVLTTSRVLARVWRQRWRNIAFRDSVRTNLGMVFPGNQVDIVSVSALPIGAKLLWDSMGPDSEQRLRMYIALTEAYNYCCKGWFLTTREWLDPLDEWKWFIPPPIWRCEEQFIAVVSCMTGSSIDLMASEVTCPSTPVCATLARLSSGVRERRESEGKAASSLPGDMVRLCSVLRDYVEGAELLLKRSWLRYSFAVS